MLDDITLARINLADTDARTHPHHRNQRRRWLGGVAGRDGVGEHPAADAHHGGRARRSGCRATAAVARSQQARRQLDHARRDPTRVVRLCRTDLQHVAARFVERRSRRSTSGLRSSPYRLQISMAEPPVDGARPHRRHRCNARPHHSGPDRSAGLDVGTDHTLQHRCARSATLARITLARIDLANTTLARITLARIAINAATLTNITLARITLARINIAGSGPRTSHSEGSRQPASLRSLTAPRSTVRPERSVKQRPRAPFCRPRRSRR